MLTKQVFRTIQSHDQEEWYKKVTNVALFMATGGFLNEANRLLQALWKYNLPHDRNTWLPDQAFEVLWYAAGERPRFIPFGPTDIDTIEIQHRAYCSGDRYAYKMPQLAWTEYKGKDAFRMASIHASVADDLFPTAETELICLQLLQNSLSELTKLAPYEICSAASLGAELAARNNMKSTAIELAKLWASNYHENYLNYNFSIMASNRHVAPLLLKGIITDELKLNKIRCKEFVDKTILAIDDRMKSGAALVYGNLSWKELLKKLSILSINYDPDDFTEDQKKSGWIGKQPAPDKAIQEAEAGLGIKLPDDYKEFLKVSNGFSPFPLLNPGLLPVERIGILKEEYRKIYGNLEIFELVQSYPGEEGENYAAILENAIAISILPKEQEVWLIPPNQYNQDWQCWYFALGESRYKSFRHFIEEQIQQLEKD